MNKNEGVKMRNREKIEKAIEYLEETRMVLYRVLGEMDAMEDCAKIARGQFKLVENKQSQSNKKEN